MSYYIASTMKRKKEREPAVHCSYCDKPTEGICVPPCRCPCHQRTPRKPDTQVTREIAEELTAEANAQTSNDAHSYRALRDDAFAVDIILRHLRAWEEGT